MNIPKPKKRRKQISIVKQLDELTRKIVMARDKKCVICGATERLQKSHFFGAGRYPRLRWDLANVHAMCAGCHALHHHGGQEYVKWWMDKYGRGSHDYFLFIGNQVMSSAERRAFRESEKARLIDYMHGKIENLKERNQ